jgi:hypothetical protein
MLTCQSSAIRSSNQDRSGSNSSGLPIDDRDRLIACAVAMGYADMDLIDWRVYNHLIFRCWLTPIANGQSCRIVPIDRSPTVIGQAIGIDRAHVSRSLKTLIAEGYAAESNGVIWPTAERIRERAEQLGFRADAIAASVPIPHGERADSARPGVPIPHGDSIEDAGAPARSIRMNSGIRGENPENTGSLVCLNSSLESAKDQDDTHTQMHGRLKHPLSPEEETRIIAFCDTHFPMMAVAENYLSNCRGLFPASWIVKALKRAKLARKCRWAYVREIMRSWECVGGPDPGEEDRYDDDMLPIPVEVAAILPISSPRRAGPTDQSTTADDGGR